MSECSIHSWYHSNPDKECPHCKQLAAVQQRLKRYENGIEGACATCETVAQQNERLWGLLREARYAFREIEKRLDERSSVLIRAVVATCRSQMESIDAELNAAPQSQSAGSEAIQSESSHRPNSETADAAPHVQTDRCGFDRNASHSEGRYVCLCESTSEEQKRHELNAAPQIESAGSETEAR